MIRYQRALTLICVLAACVLTDTAPRMLMAQARQVDPLSVSSLLLKVMSGGETLGTATGFVVRKGSSYYLVTNWHVVSGRRPDNDAPMDPKGRIPDEVQIFHNLKGRLGEWHWVSEDLLDSKTRTKRWIEHPKLGKRVDVVMLELTKIGGSDLYPVNLDLRSTPILIQPAGTVSLVGFPFGHASYLGLPIWKTGTIASDPDIDYDDSPQFLVDATGRPGMSGSPVYARRVGGYLGEDGNYKIFPGAADRFVGVFAGSIDGASEIGRVWKSSALMEIYNGLE